MKRTCQCLDSHSTLRRWKARKNNGLVESGRRVRQWSSAGWPKQLDFLLDDRMMTTIHRGVSVFVSNRSSMPAQPRRCLPTPLGARGKSAPPLETRGSGRPLVSDKDADRLARPAAIHMENLRKEPRTTDDRENIFEETHPHRRTHTAHMHTACAPTPRCVSKRN